ncbi:MAG: alpha/beta hydrolase [Micrococcales bacterium]|nr:MAG: alpha/beta hydrolase [Micrococcales bacterium]
MAWLDVNGVRLSYEITGEGPPVLLVMGSGARGRMWHLHQVPALTAAGYRVVTFDNRGIRPTTAPPGPYSVADFVGDTAGLIEGLRLGRCHVAGMSLGAFVTQELALARPDLVASATMIGTRGRTDFAREMFSRGIIELLDAGVRLPPAFDAAMRALQYLSPATLADDRQSRDWVELFELFPYEGDGLRDQMEATLFGDRLAALRGVEVPSLVIAFEHDVLTTPALCREVADAIPGCRYEEVAEAGHFGHVERPDVVNDLLVSFLASAGWASQP